MNNGSVDVDNGATSVPGWNGAAWARAQYTLPDAAVDTPPDSLWDNNFILLEGGGEQEAITVNLHASLRNGMWVVRNFTEDAIVTVTNGEIGWTLQNDQTMLIVADEYDGTTKTVLGIGSYYRKVVSSVGSGAQGAGRGLVYPGVYDAVYLVDTTLGDMTLTPNSDWRAGDSITLNIIAGANDAIFAGDVIIAGVTTNPWSFTGVGKSYTLLCVAAGVWRIVSSHIP